MNLYKTPRRRIKKPVRRFEIKITKFMPRRKPRSARATLIPNPYQRDLGPRQFLNGILSEIGIVEESDG